MVESNKYPRGSEWRRWDLHVHTPGTAMEDAYPGWDSFVAAIRAEEHVRVIGITDYLSISNYVTLLEIKNSKGLGNVELLIPNIEFRITPATKGGAAINLHLLVDPSAEAHIESINNALSRLSTTYLGQPYSCVPEQIKKLGAAYNRELADDKARLEEGTKQFKIDFSQFRAWLKNDQWLSQNSLVAISAGEDGPSGLKGESWGAVREEMWRFAHIVFSGNPQNRDYWLAKDHPKKADAIKMGAPKPCVHGSDAHSLEKLFKPSLQRYCWVKADPTFEGLRQILYEPEERVSIGEQPPIYHDASRVISQIVINDRTASFPADPIPLNHRLVCLIGPKGSGKSALADLISYSAGAVSGDGRSSFLYRAREYINGIGVIPKWEDGKVTAATIGDDAEHTHLVRYLSQSFVERLCSEDYAGTDLTTEIESVIFGHLDPTDTLNASSFSDLRKLRTQDTERERTEITGRIKSLIAEDERLREAIKTLPDKKQKIEELGRGEESLQKQLPQAASPAEARAQEEAAALREQLRNVQAAVGNLKQTVLSIEHLQNTLERFRATFSEFRQGFLREAQAVGIAESVLDLQIRVVGEAAIVDRKTELETHIGRLEGRIPGAQEPTILALSERIKGAEGTIAADRARKTQIQQIQKRIAATVQEIQRLQAEVVRIETPMKTRLTALREERLNAYEDLFKSWHKEQRVLAKLYEPVQEKLATGDKEERELDFYIRWDVDADNWLERAGTLLDQRKAHPFGSPAEFRRVVEKLLVSAWTSGDPVRVRKGMDTFLQQVKEHGVESCLKGSVSHSLLLEWIFDVSHIRLNYGLRYNQVELEKLSPGTKGIVLLILYLAMDTDDTRPLIVDQPEENLDNESIYSLLSGYFRRAKQGRQVLVITHNPNLVVNTDADQVIVAAADRQTGVFPKFSYTSGSLENPVIRKKVCSLLEGGETAFLEREKRYALKRA